MSKVKFIIGRTNVGKTYKILNEIKEKCTNDPLGNPIFIITPDQMTFHMEYQLLNMIKNNSTVRSNVTSFNRLAHRIMQEVGGLSRDALDDVGKAMLLKKIMLARFEDLGIFSKYIKKPGFIKKMDELFSEFKNYQVDTQQLINKLDESNISKQSKQKIEILSNIYEEFNETTLTKYLTKDDYFTFLIQSLEKSELIEKSEIYIDGYHTFNSQEQEIIVKLANTAKSTTILLTLDETDDSTLWNTTKATFADLTEKLKSLKPEVSKLQRNEKQHLKPSELAHLERNFMQGNIKYDGPLESNINLFNAPNRISEIEEVAKRIYSLAYDDNIAYSNIAIYMANPSKEARNLKTIFSKYDIPIFLDFKESMMMHPVINTIHKVFEIFTSNWSNNKIFGVVKNGLFIDVENFASDASYEKAVVKHLEEIDVLENYVIARNIKKLDWVSGKTWHFSKFGMNRQTDEEIEIEALINNTKHKIAFNLLTLEENLKSGTTAKEMATAVFTFLENLDVPKKLQLMMTTAEAHGFQKEKKQHEQVWHKILQILEQIVEVTGDLPIELEEFIQIFKTGLEQLNFSTVPPSLDAVQIGDLTRSRYQLATNFYDVSTYGIKHAFIIGANDGVIPSTPAETSLLSEKEREALKGLGAILAPSLIEVGKDEIFNIYTILSSASCSVTISYTTDNSSHPSYILTIVSNMFPAIDVVETKEEDLYERLTTEKALLDKTLSTLNSNADLHYHIEPVLNYFEKHDQQNAGLIKSASHYKNVVDELPQELTQKIYTKEIEASVSRLEMFNKCQFAHFLSYGLKLRERDTFELEISDIGTLYHEALKHVSILIRKDGRSFASLSFKEITQLAQLGVDEVIKKDRSFEVLVSNVRMQVLKRKLTAVVQKTITALMMQGKRSDFKESFFELRFGKNVNEHGAYGIKTKTRQVGDFTLSLKGIIDRIDTTEVDERRYVRVVDYKSGKNELALDSVYYGLSLQLLTYLDIAVNGLNASHNAGALYFHVHNPFTQINEELLSTDFVGRTVLNEQTASYRMTGYLPENLEVAKLSDTHLADGAATRSDVVPITLKKDETFAARGNNTLSAEDFDILRIYANNKIVEAVELMTEGQININPSKHKAASACDWCKYKSVCKFDPSFNKERNLPKMKESEALEKIKEQIST